MWKAEFRGKKFAERLGGLAIGCWSLDSDLQVPAQPADNPAPGCAGDDFHGDFHRALAILRSELLPELFLVGVR